MSVAIVANQPTEARDPTFGDPHSDGGQDLPGFRYRFVQAGQGGEIGVGDERVHGGEQRLRLFEPRGDPERRDTTRKSSTRDRFGHHLDESRIVRAGATENGEGPLDLPRRGDGESVGQQRGALWSGGADLAGRCLARRSGCIPAQ